MAVGRRGPFAMDCNLLACPPIGQLLHKEKSSALQRIRPLAGDQRTPSGHRSQSREPDRMELFALVTGCWSAVTSKRSAGQA